MGNRCPNGHSMTNMAIGKGDLYEYYDECDVCGHVQFMRRRPRGMQRVPRALVTEATDYTIRFAGVIADELKKAIESEVRRRVRLALKVRKRSKRRSGTG